VSRPSQPAAGAPAELVPPPDTTLPDGFAVELADDVHRSRDGRLLLGGSPPRLLRLSGSRATCAIALPVSRPAGPRPPGNRDRTSGVSAIVPPFKAMLYVMGESPLGPVTYV
jgi:hypothetical protein